MISLRRVALALALALVGPMLAACGDDASPAADTAAQVDAPDATATDDTATADDATPDAAVPDAADAAPSDAAPDGDTDATSPPAPLAAAPLGARIWGPIIQLSRTGRTLWVGTRGVPEPLAETRIRAGLFRYDLDTGATRVFEDELPHAAYYDFGAGAQVGPVPTAAVHADAGRLVVVAYDGLLTLAPDGTFAPFPITLPQAGGQATPTHVGIARDGLRPVAWMSTDRGLLRLDEDSFAVETVIATPDAALTGQWGALAVDPDTGDAYAAFYPDGAPSRIVRATVAGTLTTLVPGADGTPTGLVGQLAWSPSAHAVYAAIGGWAADKGGVLRWDGTTATTVVTEAQLARASTGTAGAFGAQVLALDDTHHVLAVGGHILGNPVGPSKGGGLAWVDLTTPDHLVAVHIEDTPFVAIHASSLAIDPVSGRTYAALSDVCSETRLRALGLYALSFDDAGALRFERPLLSGVRALDVDAAGATVRLGLRDDFAGLACDGYPIQTGVVAARAHGGGELLPVHTRAASPSAIGRTPAVTAFAPAPDGALAVATWREGVFYGPLDDGVAENPTTWGASLFVEDVLRVAGDADKGAALWFASRTHHSPGDPPNLADVGPRGAVRVDLNDRGDFAGATHFVRASNQPSDVVGLPTSDVRDLLLAPDGAVYLACARERLEASPYDRDEEPPFEIEGVGRPGGVARVIAGDVVEIVTTSAATPDPRALGWDAAGALLVGDAEVGLVRVGAGGAVTPVALGAPVPPGAIVRFIWTGGADPDDLVVGYDRGVFARLGGAVAFVDGVGFTWAAARFGPGVLVGSDAGLVRIAPEGASWPAFAPVAAAAAPPFEVVTATVGGGGDCLTAGQVCSGQPDGCCAGLSCGGSGFVPMCE